MAASSHSTSTSRRAMLGMAIAAPAIAAFGITAAQATPAASPEFDDAMSAYHAARDADEYDWTHGALGKANAVHDEQSAALLVKYGHGTPPRSGPDADQWNAMYETVRAAEDEHNATFSRARWDAAAAVIAMPAPTLAALLLKVDVAIAEGDDEALAGYVRADIARLAAREA